MPALTPEEPAELQDARVDALVEAAADSHHAAHQGWDGCAWNPFRAEVRAIFGEALAAADAADGSVRVPRAKVDELRALTDVWWDSTNVTIWDAWTAGEWAADVGRWLDSLAPNSSAEG